MGKQKNWTKEELNYLQNNWGTVSVPGIAKHLGRSVNAIIIKKDRLGLGSFLENGEYISYNQLLHAIGVSGSIGYKNKSWIKNRNFPIKYKTVVNCKFRVVYLKDFWEWADANRGLINWSKVERNSLGPEPEWVASQRRNDHLRGRKIKTTPWTTEEDNILKNMLKQFKYSYRDLSKELRRSEGAIQRRIVDLGVKERPLKGDNHIAWTTDEYQRLGEMIKLRMSYELMAEELNKSSKAIRGRVYDMYLTESIDKVAVMIGSGNWGDGRPERPISHRLLSASEKNKVKNDITKLVGVLKGLICSHYDSNDYWQHEICMNWDDGCTAGETDCDNCTSFIRIRPQYCRRCGATFLKREEAKLCERCVAARKKQYQRKWAALNNKYEKIAS